MFNIEQAIVEWRGKMFAARISGSTLEELESHLREEVAQQMRMGLNDERQAFDAAVSQIGKGAELRKEFTKDKGLLALLGEDKFRRMERILGALWLAFCFVTLFQLLCWRGPHFRAGPVCLGLYGIALYGSMLLIRGVPMGRRIIRTIAAGFTVISLVLFFIGNHWSVLSTVFTIFYFVSACILGPPYFSKPAAVKR